MIRRLPFLLPLALLFVLGLSGTASAKYAPPPPPGRDGHVVSTVGWLAPVDVRKLDEECEIVKMQTGFVIDVLLADNAEPIADVADETFKAWKPGYSTKDNGILLVVQPNFPQGDRKARLQVGKGVEGVLSAAKANDIMRTVMGPLLNGTSEIRESLAAGVKAIGEAVGAKMNAPRDAGAGSAGSAGSSGSASGDAHADESGNPVLTALGGFVALVLAYVAFMWFRGSRKKG